MSSRAGSALAVSQTLAELLEANQGYLNWLDSIGAEDAKRDFIASLERVATPAFEAYYYVPTATLCLTPLVQVGGVNFSPYTHRSTNLMSFADPLNLLFTGNAKVDRVADLLMKGVFPPWLSTQLPLYNCAETHYVYVDNGIEPKWQPMNYTLAIGGCALHRCHIRLFDGGLGEQLGEFTLASVHYEESHPSKIHAIQDWDRSQGFVRQTFESSGFCKQIRDEQFQSKYEVVQNVPHDGVATVLELR
jgi:hypothetical protein